MQIKYVLKTMLPDPAVRAAEQAKMRLRRVIHSSISNNDRLEDQFPWCSPNVWQELTAVYSQIETPILFEYGVGTSTIWHIRNLRAMGGAYAGVEHDADWYVRVLNAILADSVRCGLNVECVVSNLNDSSLSEHDPLACDAHISVSGTGVMGCTVKLHLRPPRNRGNDTDGTLAEFAEYVRTPLRPADLVVIDGRARKACVQHILDTALVRDGGAMVLFEAGRGIDGWHGSPALTGTSDYQPEVRRMLALGARLVDGCGVARWPGMKAPRILPESNAYSSPLEACILHVPARA